MKKGNLKYHIATFGCQMNLSDSERISAVLEDLGYSNTKNENEADLIIYNTCSVRQRAEDRVLGKRKIWKKMKKEKPELILGLTGCMVGHGSYNLNRLIPEIDIVFNINELPKLSDKLKSYHDINPSICYNQDYFEIVPKINSPFQVSVPIMKGCDNFCTYCIVPFSRGREQSRPVSDIVNEVKALVKKGAYEVILLGQNVNSYLGYREAKRGRSLHLDAKKEKDKSLLANFPELLKEVNKVPGLKRIRFQSPHPKDFSDEMIDAIANLDKVCEHIHLPVQAGNDEILKRMNRHYTCEEFIKLVEKIRKRVPNAAIGTDIIVGFCGETKEQFKDSVKLFEEMKFDYAYISIYSPRPKAAASTAFSDDVPYREKKRRWDKLNKILGETSYFQNKKYKNKIVEVLVEDVGEGKRKNIATGRTRTNKLVNVNLVPDSSVKVGDSVMVKIKNPLEWVLEGKEVEQKIEIKTELPVIYA